MAFLFVSTYLIASFFWRFLVVAHEGELQTEQYLTIGLDVVAIAGLIFVNTRLSKGKPLFWIALAAGVGLLAMRFLNGQTGWWSGHLAFELCPRVGDEIVCRCQDKISIAALCP
jgi:hypothetical protein